MTSRIAALALCCAVLVGLCSAAHARHKLPSDEQLLAVTDKEVRSEPETLADEPDLAAALAVLRPAPGEHKPPFPRLIWPTQMRSQRSR
jgi:hypothetical protein